MNSGVASSSTFRVTVKGCLVAEVRLDRLASTHAPPTVGEVDRCSFSVQQPDPELEYQVRIGDIEPDESLGRDFGELVLWEQAPYFESARGRVWVTLNSRSIGSQTSFRKRAELLVNVLPTKLGDQRYEAMVEDLRSVSVGLVFDLLSKGRLSVNKLGAQSISSRPANIELVVLEKMWSSLSESLQQIAVQPVTGLLPVRESQVCWGSERLGRVGLRELAMAGVDPRKRGVPRPFRARREFVTESLNTPEHRTILGFLNLLLTRAEDCRRRAEGHIASIVRDRPFRDVGQADGSNLFVDVDEPKIERLRFAARRADHLYDRISSARRLEFLQGGQPELRLPDSPVFRNVQPYRKFRDEVLTYFGSSLAMLDEGVEERAKSTSRMYEQWIFLQLLSAFRLCGLQAVGQEGLLTRSTRDRFTIDIERGTKVWFASGDGRTLRVRYEPWIHPVSLARSLHDTVYRGRSGDSSWSPDVLVEVLSEDHNGKESLRVDYAVVIDAKYTHQINQRHKDGAQKYNEIRRTLDDRPIVKQV
jgi:hypothetical protein